MPQNVETESFPSRQRAWYDRQSPASKAIMESIYNENLTCRLTLETRLERVRVRKQALRQRVEMLNQRKKMAVELWNALQSETPCDQLEERDWVPVFRTDSLPLSLANIMAAEYEVRLLEHTIQERRRRALDFEQMTVMLEGLKDGSFKTLKMQQILEKCQFSEAGKAELINSVREKIDEDQKRN
ncbi:hypothetical protein BJ508DRAFT_333833 [Ascobolus immersus RN42]|uniref:Uncharacterized protein n=1 Tax=Ascobolus immersus RN42 TaxID=1160509 RepID=A0A3N4HIF6_ASCIM|nr:hypothetical protein BJ508DRAFT_333833 [Ascobolus immersus RN42]